VDRKTLVWGDDEQAQAMATHYQWRRASNLRYDIYVGAGAMMSTAVVVVDRLADAPRVVYVRRLSALERLRGLLGI